MTLRSDALAAFEAIAREGTVHAAARALALTQSAVTRRLQALESDLGATLFLRSRQGMRLTPEGQALARYCAASRALEGELAGALGVSTSPDARSPTASPIRRFVVTGPTSVVHGRIVPACARLLAARPELGLRLTFRIRDEGLTGDALRRGETDFEILEPRRVADEFESRLLAPERYLLVAPAAWKGRRLRDIVATETIVDFDEADDMTYRWLGAQGLREFARPERHLVNSTEMVALLVAAGVGYGVLTVEAAAADLAADRLVVLGGGKALEHRLALAWYRRSHPSPAFAALLEALR